MEDISNDRPKNKMLQIRSWYRRARTALRCASICMSWLAS